MALDYSKVLGLSRSMGGGYLRIEGELDWIEFHVSRSAMRNFIAQARAARIESESNLTAAIPSNTNQELLRSLLEDLIVKHYGALPTWLEA